MKKFIAIILAVMMVLSGTVVAAAEETATIKVVSEAFTEEGQVKTVEIVAENVGNVTVLQLDLEYDATKLELVSVTTAESAPGVAKFMGIMVNSPVGYFIGNKLQSGSGNTLKEPGKISIAWMNAMAEVIDADGVLVTLEFKAISEELGEAVVGFAKDPSIADESFMPRNDVVVDEESEKVEIDYVHDHAWSDWKVEVEAGCATNGKETRHCTSYNGTCDATETKTTDPKGHTPGEAVVENEVDATCDADGSYDSVVYCTVCGEVVSKETVTIPATGHTPGEAVVENEVDATCDTDGSYDSVVYCTVCGEVVSKETVAIPATGHDWGDWEITKEGSCDEHGEETRTCKNGCGETETRPTEQLGHKFGEWVVTTEPTCTEAGEETSTCSACGEVVTKEIAALGHTPGEAVVENKVDATCDTDGSYDTVVYCTVCGEEISRETTTVPALGHSYDEGAVTTEPTCTEAGVKTYTCATCGDTKTEAIPATGHDYKYDTVKEPTCTEAGERLITCANCNYSETEAIPALGHDWSAWKVIKAPTYKENGISKRTCGHCGAEETKIIDKLVYTGDYVNPGVTVITPGTKVPGESNPNTGAASVAGLAVLAAIGAAAVAFGKKNK